jgi:polar amino acid transport system substrate-binding protein
MRVSSIAWTVVLIVAAALAPMSGGIGDARAEPVDPSPRFAVTTQRGDKPVLDSNTIRFLTSGDFPPFNFMDPTGRLAGYNVDLAEALCRQLGANCTLQMRPFDDLLPALQQKRGDAVIAGLASGPTTRDQAEMSKAYLGLPGRFVSKTGTTLTPTPEALEGRWISVVSGTAHEAFLLDHFPKARIAAYPNQTAARDALRDGTVDAHFGDAMSLSFWLAGPASRGCCAFLGGPFLERSYFGEGLRIAVPIGQMKLRRAMDWALDRLAESGTLAEIYLRWFPNSYY